MRNIVGQPVSGKDYFQRKVITRLIYRRLDAGSNLFMALNIIAEENEISKTDLLKRLKSKSKKKAFLPIIESLEYDGYINLSNDKYAFNSPILQLWWNKYIRN